MLLWLLAHYIFCSIFVRSAMCGQVCSKEVGIGHASTNPLRCFETVLYGQQRSIAAVIKWNVYGGTIYFLTPVFGICLSLFMFVSWLAQMINHVYIHFICVFVLTMFILFLSGRHAGTAQNTCFFQQPRNEISNIFVKLISCSQNLTFWYWMPLSLAEPPWSHKSPSWQAESFHFSRDCASRLDVKADSAMSVLTSPRACAHIHGLIKLRVGDRHWREKGWPRRLVEWCECRIYIYIFIYLFLWWLKDLKGQTARNLCLFTSRAGWLNACFQMMQHQCNTISFCCNLYLYIYRDMDSGKPFTAPFVPHSWGQEVLALQVGAGTAYVVQVQRHGLSFVMFVTKPLSHAKPSSMVWKRHEKTSRLGSMNCLGNLRPPLSSFCFRKYNWACL